jgi:hypothetical protein
MVAFFITLSERVDAIAKCQQRLVDVSSFYQALAAILFKTCELTSNKTRLLITLVTAALSEPAKSISESLPTFTDERTSAVRSF